VPDTALLASGSHDQANRAAPPEHSFPGQGQMKPEQSEIARLKREVAKLKAERDILKKAAAYFAKEST
jgi:transposase